MRKLITILLFFAVLSSEGQYVKKMLTAGTWPAVSGVTVTGIKMAFGLHIPTVLSNGSKPGLIIYLAGQDDRGPTGDTITSAGVDHLILKGIPKQVATGELGTFTIPGQSSPSGDRKWAVLFPQCSSSFSTFPVAYVVEVMQWAIANIGSQIDTNRIIVVGYSLGAGCASACAGNSYTNPRLAHIDIIALGYKGAINYQYMADSGLGITFYHNVNDPTALVSLSDNFVASLNALHPLNPVQYFRFNDMTNVLGGVNQHDYILPAVINLTAGTNYSLANGDTWTLTKMLTRALSFTNKRISR